MYTLLALAAFGLFSDFCSEGWRSDGLDQRPPRRELLRRTDAGSGSA